LPGKAAPPVPISTAPAATAATSTPPGPDKAGATNAGDKAPSAAAAGSDGKDKAAADKPIPYTDLTLPNVLPAKAQLGLQIGLFIDAAQAKPLVNQLTALGQSSQLIQVNDPNGQPWVLLLAGPYKSLDEARTQRQALRRGLALHHAPALLMLPPPKKKEKDG
jgi:cell division protein FtsN